MELTQEAVPTTEWVAIITALFVGATSLLTAAVAGVILVLQVLQKADTNQRLDRIDTSVNGNLHEVKANLVTALDALQAKPFDEAAALDAMVENHRELHRPPAPSGPTD